MNQNIPGIWRPEVMRLTNGIREYWGSDQSWYADAWQRQAGCGPATGANLIWYLAKTNENLQVLWPDRDGNKMAMLQLMQQMWDYITPNHMGVNKTSIFAQGAINYAADNGISLYASVLDIKPFQHEMNRGPVREFLHNAFSQNVMVAFLNLDAGRLRNLESWHWVTLYAVVTDALRVAVLDQGRKKVIDLDVWLQTTRGGGGLVALTSDRMNSIV